MSSARVVASNWYFTVLLAGVLSAVSPAWAAAGRSSAVDRPAGDVQVSAYDGAPWLPARAGDALPIGAEVRTGASSSVFVMYSDGSAVRLEQKTALILMSQEVTAGGPVDRLKMVFGKVWVRLGSGAMYVETPKGVASVRGSYLQVDYDPTTGVMTASCLEGTCSLTMPDGTTTLLRVGAVATITNTGEPPILGSVDDATFNEWMQNFPEAVISVQDNTGTGNSSGTGSNGGGGGVGDGEVPSQSKRH